MTNLSNSSEKLPVTPGKTPFKPQTAMGWWALGLTIIAVVSWVALPMITINFRDIYPITDTWVMPVIGVVLADAAAVLGALAVFWRRERSIANLVALSIMAPAAVFFTMMVIGEGLAGV